MPLVRIILCQISYHRGLNLVKHLPDGSGEKTLARGGSKHFSIGVKKALHDMKLILLNPLTAKHLKSLSRAAN